MRPPLWQPPVDPSPSEQTIMRLIKRAKLFVFLRTFTLRGRPPDLASRMRGTTIAHAQSESSLLKGKRAENMIRLQGIDADLKPTLFLLLVRPRHEVHHFIEQFIHCWKPVVQARVSLLSAVRRPERNSEMVRLFKQEFEPCRELSLLSEAG